MSNPNRVQAGVPAGGQFAGTSHAEPSISIGAFDADSPVNDDEGIADGVRRSSKKYRDDGSLSEIIRYNDEGITSDAGPGRPAVSEFYADGTIQRELHFDNGRPVDLPDGTPHERTYHPDGSVFRDCWADGHFGTNHDPGQQILYSDPRDDSLIVTAPEEDGGRVVRRGGNDVARVTSTSRLFTSSLNDGPGGEPAVTYIRPNGTISSTTSYRDGKIGQSVDYFPDGTVAATYGEEGAFENE